MEILIKLTSDKDVTVRSCVAGNPKAALELLRVLSVDKEWEVREAVAKNLSTPSVLLTKLSADENWRVRRAVSENSITSQAILEELATDINNKVRKVVAENEKISLEILKDLARDKNWQVRMAIANSHNTPPEILELLSKDKSWQVRKEVASNWNTPLVVLKKLSTDKIRAVHENLLINPNAPPEIFIQFLGEESDAFALLGGKVLHVFLNIFAEKNDIQPESPSKISKKSKHWVVSLIKLKGASKPPVLTAKVLKECREEMISAIRSFVADYASTFPEFSSELLEVLKMKDIDEEVFEMMTPILEDTIIIITPEVLKMLSVAKKW